MDALALQLLEDLFSGRISIEEYRRRAYKLFG